jgi:hypothetical protein
MRLKAPVSKAAILPAFDFARAAKGPSIRNICPSKITSYRRILVTEGVRRQRLELAI